MAGGPRAAGASGEPGHFPMPIVVGVLRSGTTLLRLMLDSHPELAIPPETGFLVGASQLEGSGDELRDRLIQVMTELETWQDFDLPMAEIRRELGTLEPFRVADGVRAFYRLYASRFG